MKGTVVRRFPLESRTIKSAGYDYQNKILVIEFVHGGLYQYYDVPEKVYVNLENAESKGHYFQAEIKDVYDFDRIDEEGEIL